MLQTLSRLFHLVQFVKSWQIVLELNSKGLYRSSGKEKESCCVVFPASTKRQIRCFHIVVVQRRQRNVQKSLMHVQLNRNPVGLNHLWLKLIQVHSQTAKTRRVRTPVTGMESDNNHGRTRFIQHPLYPESRPIYLIFSLFIFHFNERQPSYRLKLQR